MGKITNYTELAETPHDDDLLLVVDVSDTTQSASGTTKKVKKSNLGTGTGTIVGTVGVTDNAVPRADGTGGSTLQASGNKIDDSNNLTMAGDIIVGGYNDVQSTYYRANTSQTNTLQIAAGSGTSGGDVLIDSGSGTTGDGGDIQLRPSASTSGGANGQVAIVKPTTLQEMRIDTSALTANRTLTMADANVDLANVPTSAEKTVLGNTSGTNTGDQNAAGVSVAATPTNYTAGSANVEAHLSGIDTALATAGGGGQSTYTYIIGTGGDYETLNAYVADTPANNDRLFISTNQTLTALVNLGAYTDIEITGASGVSITLGAYNLQLGVRANLHHITINQNGAGYIYIGGDYSTVDSIIMNKSVKGTGIFPVNGIDYCHITNNKIISTIASDYYFIRTGNGKGNVVSGNILQGVSGEPFSPWIYHTGQYGTIDNNTMNSTTGITNSVAIQIGGTYNTVNGNTINSYFSEAIKLSSGNNIISANMITMFYANSQGIDLSGASCTVSGNYIYAQTTGCVAIPVSQQQQVITGNTIRGFASGTGISIDNGDDHVVISGNLIHSWTTAILVGGVSTDYTTIIGNLIYDNTTDINDLGTNTLLQTATDSDPLNNIY